MKRKSLQERFNDFKQKANELYNNKYDYSNSIYINNSTHINIKCNIHNEIFSQTPGNHLYFEGCETCKTIKKCLVQAKTQEQFILDARKVHGNKYDYSKANYINWKTKICIICPYHGEFWQEPNSHTSGGSGCFICGRFANSVKGGMSNLKNLYEEKATLYLYEFKNNLYNFLKIGVTSQVPISKRFKGSIYSDYEKILLFQYNDFAINVLELEQKCLNEFKNKKYFINKEDAFKGCSELIKLKYKDELLKFLYTEMNSTLSE